MKRGSSAVVEGYVGAVAGETPLDDHSSEMNAYECKRLNGEMVMNEDDEW